MAQRRTSVLFRMDEADKARLVHDAQEMGITVQALLERRALGRLDAVTNRGGRPRRLPQVEELPLTG